MGEKRIYEVWYVERLEARVAELEGALIRYGEHEPECGKWDKMDSGQLFARHDWPCTCGLEQALGGRDD
jgi:hypothetical protein